MIHRSFASYFPPPLPTQYEDSIVRQFADIHQQQYNQSDVALEAVRESRQVRNARGKDLNNTADVHGKIARRGTRGDEEYQRFIQSIVPTLQGRGSVSDVNFAIRTVVLAPDKESIELTEDFSEQEYSIRIYDWAKHDTRTVHEIADLADPVGVDRTGPIEYQTEDETTLANDDVIGIGSVVELPSETTYAQDDPVKSETTGYGFGSSEFGNDEFGPGTPTGYGNNG